MTEETPESDDYEVQQKYEPTSKQSVTYNKEINRFNYNEEFFRFIAEVDEETKEQIKDRFSRAEHALSMEFSANPRIVQPIRPTPNPQEVNFPIIDYDSV